MTEALRLGTTNRRLDMVAVEQGIAKECPMRRGLTVTILPAGTFSEPYRQASERRIAKLQENGSLPSRYDDPEFVAGAFVKDMRGLYNADGEEVAYTHERGVRILSDPANGDVMMWIVGEAELYDKFYTDAIEADAGNSSSGSNGNSVGAVRSEATPS